MELEALVRQMGFLPFFRCSIPQFSIEEFTPGRYWFVEGVEGPWEWRMELARRGAVAYGKLFAKKAGLVSREWYPGLPACTTAGGAARRRRPAWPRRPEAGHRRLMPGMICF